MPVTSRFNRRPVVRVSSPQLEKQEHFNLSGGLNLYAPDETMRDEQTPYARNVRLYPPDNNDNRVPIRTRLGEGFYSVPIGETLDDENTPVTGALSHAVTHTSRGATKFTPTSTARLTKVELLIGNDADSPTGPVIVEIYDDDSGEPGTLMATSSLLASSIPDTPDYIAARFIEAPSLTSGTDYWIVAYTQDNGTGTYLWRATTASSGSSLTSIDSGVTWGAVGSDFNFKTYLSTDGGVKGQTRFVRSDGTKYQVFAHGTTLYSVNDITGATTAIKTGLSSDATHYRFAVVADTLFYVNGYDAPRQWDGTTESACTCVTTVSSNIILHKDKLWFQSAADPNLILFTNDPGGDFTTARTSTNFLYVPSPKNSDPVVGWAVLQDNLVVWSKNAKYVIYGSKIADLTLRRATGLKGAVNQEVIKTHDNQAYFLSDDGVYKFNGATDENVGILVGSEIDGMADKTRAVAEVQDNKYRLYYPSAGAGGNNRALVLDLLYNAWFIDDNRPIGATNVWDQEGDTLIHGSNVVGALYYADTLESDLGRPITFDFRTKYFAYSSPAAKKKIRRIYPLIRATGNWLLTLGVDKDYANSPNNQFIDVSASGPTFGSGEIFGSGVRFGSDSLIDPRLTIGGDAKFIQFRFQRTGAETPVELIGFTLIYRTKRLR